MGIVFGVDRTMSSDPLKKRITEYSVREWKKLDHNTQRSIIKGGNSHPKRIRVSDFSKEEWNKLDRETQRSILKTGTLPS